MLYYLFSTFFISALSAFAGVGYFEQIDRMKTANHGWSSIVAWIGAVSLLISSVLAFLAICIIPKQGNTPTHFIRASAYQMKQPAPEQNNYYNNESPRYPSRPSYDNMGIRLDNATTVVGIRLCKVTRTYLNLIKWIANEIRSNCLV